MFAFLNQARGLLNESIGSVSSQVLIKTQELLTENKVLAGLTAIPQTSTIRLIWKRFTETGQISRVKKTAGRKPLQVREEVQYMLSTDSSLRNISSELAAVGVRASRSLVHKIAKKEFKMRSYRAPTGPILQLEHIETRHEFAIHMRSAFRRKTIDANNVFFTDECMIGTGESSNRQNDRF